MRDKPNSPQLSPQPSKGWVILATDTGVGKTLIGCALAETLRAQGACVRVRKPVETGCAEDEEELVPADAIALWQAAGKIEPLETVCPLRFRAALAAPQAAAIEGKTLKFQRDIAPHLPFAHSPAACLTGNQNQHEYWIIESAGGVLSPLTDDTLNCELARYTRLPVLLVAPDKLGTLSGLFSAIEALHQRNIPLVGIILNQCSEAPNTPTETLLNNQALLQEWLPRLMPSVPPPDIFVVRYNDSALDLANRLIAQ